jgi:hypothetical protein
MTSNVTTGMTVSELSLYGMVIADFLVLANLVLIQRNAFFPQVLLLDFVNAYRLAG